jgi:hypothetical protein
LNWILPKYYYNIDYKSVKCRNCGIEIILNRNIKSRDGQIKPVNLDQSPHNCYKLYQKGVLGYDRLFQR